MEISESMLILLVCIGRYGVPYDLSLRRYDLWSWVMILSNEELHVKGSNARRKVLEFGMFYLRSSILFKCGEIHHGENYRGDAKYIQLSLINVNEII